MKLAMIGLGRMGGNMTARLLQAGHEMVVFNRSKAPIEKAEAAGATGAASLEALVQALEPPRVVWVMLPAGEVTEHTLQALGKLMAKGDIVVDGGNSHYTDTLRRGDELEASGIEFVDVGVSGGVWGLQVGYGMMVGGSKRAVEKLRPALETLAPGPDQGWGHMGKRGAGHYAKMVHNGIEYGMMQAYAEGFAILRAKKDFEFDLHQVAEAWRFGTVIRSWLLDLVSSALESDPNLPDIAAWVDDSGEGRWTVEESIQLSVPAPVISQSLYARFRSRQSDNYADKLLAAMRHQFGGHAIKEE
jgi:6-phosphogluconate dehydrogenase